MRYVITLPGLAEANRKLDLLLAACGGGQTTNPTPTPLTLTVTGDLTFATDATVGTVIAAIGNVPAGVTPTLTPNDGRLVIAGNASTGWKLAVGMSASSVGTIPVTVAATGAISAAASVVVTAAVVVVPPSGNLPALNSKFYPAMNSPAADYYTASVIEADYGKSMGIYARDGDGYGQLYPPHSGIKGLATWKTAPGITLGGTSTGIQVVSTDGTTGIHRVNILTDGPTDTDTRIVNFNGPKPAYITVTRDGVAGEFAPEALNAKFGAFMRNLDMGTQNGTDPNATTRQDDADLTDASPFNIAIRANGDGYAAIPWERQVRFTAAKRAVDPEFLGVFDVIAVDRTEAQIRSRARYMRDHGGGAYWMFQCFNEDPWNVRFQGVFRVIVEAFRHGFYGTGTHANPAPAINPLCRPDYIGPGAAVSPATKAGDYVLFHIGGRGGELLRAKKDVPAGSPVDDNEFWQTVYHHTDTQNFGKNYQAHFLNRTCDIIREEYGDARYATEVVPVLMGQNGGSSFNGSVLGQFAQHRAFVPELWAKVKGFGYATYLDPGGVDGFDEDNSTVESLAYWLRYKSFAHLKDQLTVLQSEADSEGKLLVLYEGGPAMSENIGYGGKEHYTSVQLDYFTSEECALMSADYSSWMKQNLRGVGAYFTSVTTNNVAGTGLGIFGQRRSFNDITSKRYVGYQRGLTTDYTPRSTVPPAATPTPTPTPTPWTPNNLPAAVLGWHDMQSSTVTQVGGSGSDKNDITVLGGIGGRPDAVQTSASKRPAFVSAGWDGTLPCAKFDTSDLLDTTVSANAQPFTYAFALQDDRSGYVGMMTSSQTDGHAIYCDQNGSIMLDKNGVANVYASPADTLKANTKSVVVVTFAQGQPSSISVNGITSSFTYTGPGYGFQGNMSIGTGGCKIDRYAESIRVDGALSTEDRQKLEGYLAHKWKFAANLASDHPYKSAPPT